MDKFEYKEEYGWPTNACLNLTDSCNYMCAYCTHERTHIMMADGSYKEIKDIQEGDKIIAFPEVGKREEKEAIVTKVMSREVEGYLQIITSHGNTINITGEHPMLTSKGWIKAENLSKYLSSLVLYNGNFLEEKVDSIKFIQEKCTVYNLETTEHTYIANHFCVHNCFVEQHPHYMSLDTAKQSVLWLLDNLKKKQDKGLIGKKRRVRITLFGGEPMLCYDSIIVPLVSWIKENNFPIILGMTTNGSLLTKERLEFLKKNDISFMLSMDGARATQETNRPAKDGSSFDKVVENIPNILKYFPNTLFRGTINNNTVQNLFEDFLFAESMGFKNSFFIPNSRGSWTGQEKEILHEQLNKIFAYLAYHWSVLKTQPKIRYSPFNKMINDILAFGRDITRNNQIPQREINRNIHTCGLGTSLCAIGYDGNIYGCQEQVSLNNKSKFLVGNIYKKESVDKNAHSFLLEQYYKKEKFICSNSKRCDTCLIKHMCINTGCKSTNIDLYDNMFINPEIYCLWQEIIYNNTIIIMNKMIEEENELFMEYLNLQCGKVGEKYD